MKILIRIGAWCFILTAAFLIITMQRAYTPAYYSFGTSNLQPNSYDESDQLILSPQKMQISFSTTKQQKISLYVLDGAAYAKWRENRTLTYMISIVNASTYYGVYDLPKRDTYTVLLYNPPNQTAVDTEINITLYGFETDLTIATVIIAAIGVIITILGRFFSFHNKNETS